eukprot:gene24684-biopygen7413
MVGVVGDPTMVGDPALLLLPPPLLLLLPPQPEFMFQEGDELDSRGEVISVENDEAGNKIVGVKGVLGEQDMPAPPPRHPKPKACLRPAPRPRHARATPAPVSCSPWGDAVKMTGAASVKAFVAAAGLLPTAGRGALRVRLES